MAANSHTKWLVFLISCDIWIYLMFWINSMLWQIYCIHFLRLSWVRWQSLCSLTPRGDNCGWPHWAITFSTACGMVPRSSGGGTRLPGLKSGRSAGNARCTVHHAGCKAFWRAAQAWRCYSLLILSLCHEPLLLSSVSLHRSNPKL